MNSAARTVIVWKNCDFGSKRLTSSPAYSSCRASSEAGHTGCSLLMAASMAHASTTPQPTAPTRGIPRGV
eukprot:5631092-Prymnesium_polylepis.2